MQLFVIDMMDDKNMEFNAIIHLLSTIYAPKGLSTNQKKHLVVRVADNMLIARHLYKLDMDERLHRCVFYYEQPSVMIEAHSSVA